MTTFGLIGYPLSHSFSPAVFEKLFKINNLKEYQYQLFPLKSIDLLSGLLSENPHITGLNVTIPYKQSILPYLNEVDEIAHQTGAVNTIKIYHDQSGIYLKGFNTDVPGFEKSIKTFLPGNDPVALILGNGGVTKAVQYVLKKLNINYKTVSRRPSDSTILYEDLNEEIIKSCRLIINCTPLGMYPDINSCPDFPFQYLSKEHHLFDMVYNPPQTIFLKEGLKRGCRIKNGYEMLEFQAIESFNIWIS